MRSFNHRSSLLASSFVTLAVASSVNAAALDPNAYTSLGTLNVGAGLLSFDTTSMLVTGAPGLISTMGVSVPQLSGPNIVVFTFDDVSISAGVTFNVVGSSPMAILSKSDISFGAAMNVTSTDGPDGLPPSAPAPNGNNGVNGAGNANAGGFGGAAPAAAFPGGKGGDGGYDSQNGINGSMGFGGTSFGFGGLAGLPGGNGGPGHDGANGVMGAFGTGGSAGTAGGMSFSLVTGNSGANGLAGTNGRGGGGGGGGGGGEQNIFGNPNADKGGGGGSGGAGGAGGNFGSGGAGGRAVEFVAVDTVTFTNLIRSRGGAGGDGALGQQGGLGGVRGLGGDDAGDGANGGDGGDGGLGGPGGGGGGGTILISGGHFDVPSGTIDLIGGLGGTNTGGSVGGTGGTGLFRFEGTLDFDVTSNVIHDVLSVNGTIDPAGDVHFTVLSEMLADGFDTTFTLDSFFAQSGGPVPDVTPFLDVDFTLTTDTREFTATLNPDRSFTITQIPEPTTLGMLFGTMSLLGRRRRR